MRGREGKGPPSADLLVCFPSRAHLSLMPKPICSPARPPDPSTRHHRPTHRHHPHHRRRKSAGGASPLYWAKNKSHSSDISEPTSPKVTCAGQIKVRHKPRSCKNWQSVMEEIERLHNNRKQKKRLAWTEALGFKKEAMQFLTCLRNIRFDFRCFGAFPSTAVISSDDDEDEEEDDDDDNEVHDIRRFGSKEEVEENDQSSGDVFSKWFMILQDQEERKGKMVRPCLDSDEEEGDDAATAPPANALLLMRCRSAPAKSWQEEREEREREEREKREKEKREDDEKELMEDHERKQRLVVMRCGADQFSKLSADIAKETWVVGGIRDTLSRSRSWKR